MREKMNRETQQALIEKITENAVLHCPMSAKTIETIKEIHQTQPKGELESILHYPIVLCNKMSATFYPVS